MANHHIAYVVAFLTLLFTQLVNSRLSSEKLASFFGNTSSNSQLDQGTKWAVLVAGSNGFINYRHQADVCHAYQILKKGGLKDDNIIVFMYDDIAFDEENPRKGVIVNSPYGPNVYEGVPKDYTGSRVSAHNLLAVILANKTGVKGGSGKVLDSGPNDHVFIYYSDHGSPGVLTMPSDNDFIYPEDDLYAKDLIDALKIKYTRGTYKSMVIYVEACEAGSIFEGLLPEDWNIYVTTASNAHESSWAVYCPGLHPSPPDEYDTCLGDLYSVAWMENSDSHNLQAETLRKQYQEVKLRTAKGEDHTSHVMEYGDLNLNKNAISLYMGINPNYTPKSLVDINETNTHNLHDKPYLIPNPVPLRAVEQHDADILYLKAKVRKAQIGSAKHAQAQKSLEDALLHRKHMDSSFEAIAKTIFGNKKGSEMLTAVRFAGEPLVDDWDCLKTMVATYKLHCGPLSTYGKKHTRALANMCNAGVQIEEMIEATSLACGNN